MVLSTAQRGLDKLVTLFVRLFTRQFKFSSVGKAVVVFTCRGLGKGSECRNNYTPLDFVQSSMCGFAGVFELQILRLIFCG